jgi:hypothetical protein
VAVGAGSTLSETSISDSIVMEECAIDCCPGIERSMIGRFAVVRRAPKGTRLTLGDHSRFEGPA